LGNTYTIVISWVEISRMEAGELLYVVIMHSCAVRGRDHQTMITMNLCILSAIAEAPKQTGT